MPKPTDSQALLPALVVPLMQDPIDGDIDDVDGGLGSRHTETDWVVYLINPKDGVGEGSVARLYFGNSNVPVASTPIRQGEENLDLIPLAVPLHLVREYFIFPVFARLNRASGNSSETERLKLRVLLQHPGGYDPNDAEPGNQGLVMKIPPKVLIQGVDEATALQGIEITIRYWEYMHRYDLIVLAWGSQKILHRVQPDEVNHDIVLTVDYETIKAAGNSRMTRVAFQVRGATGNLPDKRALWSAVDLIDVHLNELRPDAPYLMYPNRFADRIELVDLGSANAQVDIWVRQAEYSVYSIATLIWAGTDSEGNAIPYTESRNLDRPGTHSFEIPNMHVEAITKGTAFVHVLYQGHGVPDLPSDKLTLEVLGQVIRWPAPAIKEDLGGYLDPDVMATVYFPLQGSWLGEGLLEVTFRVSGPEGTIEHSVRREVDDVPPVNGNMEFTVYPDELSRFVGYRVEVFYAYTQPGGRPHESLRLPMVVGVIQRTLPAAEVEKAIGGQLNPNDIGTYARVFSTFDETKSGDKIHMHWQGPHSATVVETEVTDDGSITAHDIPRAFVVENLFEYVVIYYTLTRGNEAPRYSAFTDVFISRGVAELLSPVLLGARITDTDTAELEPLNVEHGTKVVVTYRGMLDSDSITVTMVGTGNGGSPIIPAKPGNQALQRVEFDIAADAIAPNIGNIDQTFTLRYAVTRNGQTLQSATLTVTVKPIPLTALPRVIINGVPHGGLLDLNVISGNLLAAVAKWPFSKGGQRAWITLSAERYASLPVLTNYSVTTMEALNGLANKPVVRSWLQGLMHHTLINVELRVALDGGSDMARAVVFLPIAYSVRRVAVSADLTNFNNGNYNGWRSTGSEGSFVNTGSNIYWRSGSGVQGTVLHKRFGGEYFVGALNYRVTFDYINAGSQHEVGIRPDSQSYKKYLIPVSSVWSRMTFTATLPAVKDTVEIYFLSSYLGGDLSLDNIVVEVF